MSAAGRLGARVAAEWRLVQRDRGFWIALIVLLGCLLVATASGAWWLRSQHAVMADADASSRGSDHAGSRWAVLPPAPLGMLSVGRSDVHATALRLSAGDPESIIPAASPANPIARALGRFDVAFVVVALLPLFVMVATYDVLAADREAGRLPLLVAGGASGAGLLTMRLGLRAGPLASCAVLVPIVALAVTGATGWADWRRTASWALITVAYVAFWAAVSGLTNAARMSAATSLTAHVAIWAAAVVVIPALSTVMAGAIHPAPSRPALVVTMWGAVARHDVPGFYGAVGRDRERLRTLGAEFDEAVARQQDLAARWRFMSPALTARDALDGLAGTGVARYRSFTAQVEHHRMATGRDTRHDFVFREPSASPVGDDVWTSFVVLTGASLVVGAAAILATRRAP